jgi:outer membrane protein assembly factor BamB
MNQERRTKRCLVNDASQYNYYLDRAQKLAEKRLWKDVFSTYMELLGKQPNAVHQVTKNQWVSIYEFILEQISKLPKEAIDWYRLEFDSKVRFLYKTACEKRDKALLKDVITDYFFSSITPEAVNYLVNLLFEDGYFARATYEIRDILRYYPDLGAKRSIFLGKLAMAYYMTQNRNALEKLHKELQDSKDLITVNNKRVSVAEFVRDLSERTLKEERVSNKEEKRIVSEIRHCWSKKFTGIFGERPGGKTTGFNKKIIYDYPYSPGYAEEDGVKYLIYNDGCKIYCVDLEEGRDVWDRESIKGLESTDRLPKSYPAIYGVSIDDNLVFVNMHNIKNSGLGVGGGRYSLYHFPQVPGGIRSYELKTGDLRWATKKDLDEKDVNSGFVINPVVFESHLYVPEVSGYSERSTYVYCIEKSSGKIKWRTFISAVDRSLGVHRTGDLERDARLNVGKDFILDMENDNDYVAQVIEDQGVIYCQTNMGSICALDPYSGRILWIIMYNRNDLATGWEPGVGESPRTFYRPPSLPILHKGHLYCLPQDYRKLIVIDIMSYGEQLQRIDITEPPVYLLGIRDNKLFFVGEDGITALETEKIEISYCKLDLKQILGRPALGTAYILIPTKENLVIFDLEQMREKKSTRWKAGNAIIYGEYVISISSKEVNCYKLVWQKDRDVEKIR